MVSKKISLYAGNQLIRMGECALSLFQPTLTLINQNLKLKVCLTYDLANGKIIIENSTKFSESHYKTYQNLFFDHAPTCPCWSMKSQPDLYSFKPSGIPVNIASCIIVLDEDDNLLLTRRAKRMKTFPKAWVNPGGKLDFGESFEACAIRELAEETSIICELRETSKIYYNEQEVDFFPFYLYESVYPTSLDIGLPKFQTICLFFALKLKSSSKMIDIRLQKEECDAYIWYKLDKLMEMIEEPEDMKETIEVKSVFGGNLKIPICSLQGIYPNSIEEGIGQGHLLALKYYYSLKPRQKAMKSHALL